MKQLLSTTQKYLDKDLIRIVISNPRKTQDIVKYRIRPVLLKGELFYQCEAHTKTQVFHENLSAKGLTDKLEEILPAYKQMQLKSAKGEFTALINKKGKAAVRIKPVTKDTPPVAADFSHNRKKRYLLPEGTPVPFLMDLGVMNQEGKILKNRYDKYRQINRFLEFIEDILPALPKDREVRILDFGCGKSYLTFAIYYYLRELQGYDVEIIGLDLKKDVIAHCSKLAVKYGYEKLHFIEGAIEEYDGTDRVDMVVTLHACDTATDYALYKAICWGAEVILSVPCCQHEVNAQMSADALMPVTKYGILKERFSAMATDAIRAALLEREGYETAVLEFIDMEHTPKNLLIRAVKKHALSNVQREKSGRMVREFLEEFGLKPTLYRLLDE